MIRWQDLQKTDIYKIIMNRNRKGNNDKKTKTLRTFFVYLPFANTTYTLKNISKASTVRDFQINIELVCGIPYFIQRLHYLDMADLRPGMVLSSLDISNKATFTLNVWERWRHLITSIYKGDIKALLDQVKTSACIKNELLNQNLLNETKMRAETALFIGSHLGNIEMIKILLEMDIDINARTKAGHTSLYASIAGGKYDCIDFLLRSGATDDTKSPIGKQALEMAKLYQHTESERHLHKFGWESRAKCATSKSIQELPLRMHQQFDSKCPTWFIGPYATTYMCTTLPPGEFSGSSINSPKVKYLKPQKNRDLLAEKERLLGRTAVPFTEWMQNKKREKLLQQRQNEVIQFERMREYERQVQERQEKMKHITRRREIENRLKSERDGSRENKNIYGDYFHTPNYQKTVLHQLVEEL